MAKKTKTSKIQQASKFRRLSREDFLKHRDPFFYWSLFYTNYGLFSTKKRLLVITNRLPTSWGRNKPNLDIFAKKKRLYIRGVSTPNKANMKTKKKDIIQLCDPISSSS